MTIEFSCQSCGKKLTAKDEHVGKRGKCPSCGAINDIYLNISMSEPNRSNREAKFVTLDDVQEAELSLDRLRMHLDDATSKAAVILRRQKKLEREVGLNNVIKKCRLISDSSMTRVGTYINLIAIPSGLAFILGAVLELPTMARAAACLAVASSMGFLGLKLFNPHDEELMAETMRAHEEIGRLCVESRRSNELVRKARAILWESQSEYVRILQEYRRRINRLRSTNWEKMQGIEFENFLADVFLELGYRVETTKVTGDQGVDLIASKNAGAIAIQAKGYPSSVVGNKAVQEAHAGMSFYGCHLAVVITNSTFTSGARELAERIGCQLIDREQLSSLIEGHIRF
jgi:HJR/Mrr/RecB family endonuclease